MRPLVLAPIALAAAALLATAGAASAAPAAVTVSVAPKLQKTFDKTYGEKEATLLTADLKSTVEKALAKANTLQDGRVDLVLTDVKANRPTFKQLGDTPGLSMQSFGIGGATITGTITDAAGKQSPVDYHWYETDIREVYSHWVWTDAERSFDMLARKLARGQEVAER